MAYFRIGGQIRQQRLNFLEEFGINLRFYTTLSCKSLADESKSMVSISTKPNSFKSAPLKVGRNTKVKSLINTFAKTYGVGVRVANGSNTKLVDGDLTLAAAGKL